MGREDRSDVIRERLGRVLKNKWRLERLLAVGGMGAVYAATHRNGKRVAVKMLHPELCLDPTQCKRFLREGYAANAIGDPRVVTVDDDDVDDDGSAFLVMELLEGESLNRAVELEDKRLSVGTVLHHVDQLLSVLELAHAKGIVHRDIKPENLFVTKSGGLKVLDFGIARLRGQASPPTSDTSHLTIMGTPAYMPPEQAKGYWDRVDGRSDLWSVGATMYRLLSGHYVHNAETRSEQLGLAMTAPARSLATVAPHLDPDLIALVDRALAYEMKDRWQSAQEMRAALEPLLTKPADELVPRPVIEHAEQALMPTIDSVSAPVVSTVGSTLSMRRRREGRVSPRIEDAHGKRPLFLALAVAVAVVIGVVWSVLPRRMAADFGDNQTKAVLRAGNVRALVELASVRNPSPPSAPAPASAPRGNDKSLVASPAIKPRRLGRKVAEPSASQRVVGSSSPPSAMPAPPPPLESNAGRSQPDRQDPLDRRR